MTSNARLATVAALAFLASTSAWLYAQTGPGTMRPVIPYQGRLEQNGVGVDGSVRLRAGLFDAATLGNVNCLLSTSLSGCGVWAEEMDDVDVKGGQFAVRLGEVVNLSDGLFTNDDQLSLGFAVARSSEPFVLVGGAQPLGAVPLAVRSERSSDFTVTGLLGVGTSSPTTELHVENGALRIRDRDDSGASDIAQFYANNLSQGLGIGYSSIAALGSNADQDLTLSPRGDGAVYVQGRLLEPATLNSNGSTSTYYVDAGRYTVHAPYAASGGSTRTYASIPASVLESYCGDEDGCTVRVGMRDWDGPAGTPTSRSSTTMGPFGFYYGPLVASRHQWRRAETLTSTNAAMIVGAGQGSDGDSAVTHVVQNHDCYFTDGVYFPGTSTSNDLALGMGLLNWNAYGYQPLCWLTIDD